MLAATLHRANTFAARAAAPFEPLLLLGMRTYVSWQFLKSGWLKLSDWDNTVYLFKEEYHVPLLPPDLAAVVGTAGEIGFPLLLVAGLLGRYAALGLGAVNVLAVVSYAHVLLGEGFEAALGQHYFWGAMLLMLAIFGPGRFSVDAALQRAARMRLAGRVAAAAD